MTKVVNIADFKAKREDMQDRVNKAHNMLMVAHLTGASADDIFRAAGLSQEEYFEYIGKRGDQYEKV